MHWYTPRGSSAVRSFGYDPQRRELHVIYDQGSEYAYIGAPRRQFDRLIEVDRGGGSVGQAVNYEVKPRYPFRKVPPTRH